jgi:hypothetical protein
MSNKYQNIIDIHLWEIDFVQFKTEKQNNKQRKISYLHISRSVFHRIPLLMINGAYGYVKINH